MAEGFRALSPAARLLVVNQAGINAGFYMVLPFLASYLRDDLGLAAAVVGVVLGLRTLSQQGLFLPGGALVDRFGPWPSIVGGCGLRVVAFGLLALTQDVAGVVAGTVLVGVAGALFNPAVRAYLVLESPDHRAEAFAVFNVAGNVGALGGPVLGALLLGVDFQLVCGVAAGVFTVLTLAQLLLLPRPARTGVPTPVLVGVRQVLLDRRLLGLVLAGSAYFALFNQLYLVLPVEAQRVTGRAEAIGAVFLVSSALGILLQLRVTAWCQRRWSPGTSAAVGLALLGLSFLPGALSSPWLPTADEPLPVTQALVRAVPLLAGTVVLSVGVAVVSPFTMVLLSDLAGDRLVGTAYGWFYLVSALVTTAVSAAAGALLDLGSGPTAALPFLLLVVVGLTGAAGLAAMQRRGLLAPSGAAGPAGRGPR